MKCQLIVRSIRFRGAEGHSNAISDSRQQGGWKNIGFVPNIQGLKNGGGPHTQPNDHPSIRSGGNNQEDKPFVHGMCAQNICLATHGVQAPLISLIFGP